MNLVTGSVSFCVLGMARLADEHAGQHHENVGLQETDENLEGSQEDQHEQWQNAHWDERKLAGASLEQRFAEQREGDQQHVTGQHVGEKSDGQGERSQNDVRGELDEADQWLHRDGNAWGPQHVLEIVGLLVTKSNGDVHNPHEQGEEQRDGHTGGGRHVNDRNNSRHVTEIDEHEQRQNPRGPDQAFLADRLHDRAFHEFDNGFGKVTNALWSLQRIFVASKKENGATDNGGGDSDQGNLVEAAKDVLPANYFVNLGEIKS